MIWKKQGARKDRGWLQSQALSPHQKPFPGASAGRKRVFFKLPQITGEPEKCKEMTFFLAIQEAGLIWKVRVC